MKTHVITVSRSFPSTHNRKGEPTGFIEKIQAREKNHTIRLNYDWWKKRIDEVVLGEAILSVRVWTGRPYHSTPKQLIQFEAKDAIGISMIEQKEDGWYVDGVLTDLITAQIAENDGLSEEDFVEWFKGKSDGPMALIYFNHFRYKKYNFNFSAIENCVFDYDAREAPRYENAFLECADYGDRELTDEEVDWINENEPGFVHEALTDYVN